MLSSIFYRRVLWFAVIFMTLLILSLTAERIYDKNKTYQEVDGMVYSFIVGKVEGNDDLLAGLLTDQAQGIIVPGRHAYPGAAQQMGERYAIVRYDHRFAEGVLIYTASFYRPSTRQEDFYKILVLNTDKGWRIAQNSSVDDLTIDAEIQTKKGVTVHEYER